MIWALPVGLVGAGVEAADKLGEKGAALPARPSQGRREMGRLITRQQAEVCPAASFFLARTSLVPAGSRQKPR